MKLEGQLGDEEMAGVLKMREAWLLVMPELEGANTRASEMLRWIIGELKRGIRIACMANWSQAFTMRLSCTVDRACTAGTRATSNP